MRTPRSAPFLPEGTDSCIILKCSESSCVSRHLCLYRFCRGVTQPSPQFLLQRAGVRAGPARPRATSSPSGGKTQPRWSRPAWTTPSVFVFPRTAALPGIEQDAITAAITSSRVPWALPRGRGGREACQAPARRRARPEGPQGNPGARSFSRGCGASQGAHDEAVPAVAGVQGDAGGRSPSRHQAAAMLPWQGGGGACGARGGAWHANTARDPQGGMGRMRTACVVGHGFLHNAAGSSGGGEGRVGRGLACK